MSSFRPSRFARFLPLGALLFPVAMPVAAQQPTGAAKVVSLMQACNYNFQTTKSPSVWVIKSTGSHLKEFKVGVTLGEDKELLVVFVTVVEKRRMPASADFMRTLLQQDHNMDRVKIGFDADGDLSLRIDATLRVTDVEEFRTIIDQTRSATDELYGIIESKLVE